MNKYTFLAVALMIPFGASGDVSNLRWMAGCWAADGQEEGSIEHWSGPAGGTMFGFSRVVRNGATVAFEYLRIVSETDGTLVLVASPSGQATARFPMKDMNGYRVVFENPVHDFPQRIIYSLDEHGNLLGRIEGTIRNEVRTVDFPMTRTNCDDGISAPD